MAQSKFKMLPDQLEEVKSADRANNFRQDGNEMYKSCSTIKDYEKTYACYAQSIAHAPANSQEMSLAYANLSAVLFRLEKYLECLEAIDCCFNSGYPEKLKFKIYLRKVECLKIVDEPLEAAKLCKQVLFWIEKNQTEEEQKVDLRRKLIDTYKKQVTVKKRFTEEEVDQIWHDFSIKTFNDEIPGASSAISLNYSESLGRHFVATRDIRPGEIIIKDRPFALVWMGGSRYNCCWECFQYNTNCVPCDCCNNVIFCSIKCKEHAWKGYHQLECKLLPSYLQMPEKSIAYVIFAVRILIFGIKEYGSVEKLREAVDEIVQNKLSTERRTAGFTSGKLLSDKYQAFWSLKSYSQDVEKHGFSDLAASAVYRIATSTTLLGKQLEPGWIGIPQDKDVIFASCMLTKHMAIMHTNAYEVMDFAESGYSGVCLSILGSFFNHSCVGNIFIHRSKPYAEAIVKRPIKRGDQIVFSYVRSSDFERKERQMTLLYKYNFLCDCDACENDWPLQKHVPQLKDLNVGWKMMSTLLEMLPYHDRSSTTGEMELIKTDLERLSGLTIDIKFHRNIELLKTHLEQISGLIEEVVTMVPQYFCSEERQILEDALFRVFIKSRVAYM